MPPFNLKRKREIFMGWFKRWDKVKAVHVTADEYNETLKVLRSKYEEIEPTAISNDYHEGKISVAVNVYGAEIRYMDENGRHQKYQFLKSYIRKEKEEEEEQQSGLDCYNKINEMFKKQYGKSKSIFKCYSGKNYKEVYEQIKKITPVQINYIDPQCIGKFIDSVYKADVSSAFPTAACKDLPTLHEHKEVSGRVPASEEYPFAFYLKSGHIDVYKEFNTTNFNNKFYRDYYKADDSVAAEDDVTILCKASKYSLAEIYKELYNHRADSPEYKLFMVASIGYFQKNGDPNLAHIAAVVIGRCNNDMIKRAQRLEAEGNDVRFIATDSIVWDGEASEIATEEKYLGSFTYECKDGEFFAQGLKAYQVLEPNGRLTTKCGHVKGEANRKNLKFGEIPPVKNGPRKLIINENKYIEEIDVYE